MKYTKKDITYHVEVEGTEPNDIVEVKGKLDVYYRNKKLRPIHLDTEDEGCRLMLLDALKLWENIPEWEKPKYIPWYAYDGKRGLHLKEKAK